MKRLSRERLKSNLRNQNCDNCDHKKRLIKDCNLMSVGFSKDKVQKTSPAIGRVKLQTVCDLNDDPLPPSNSCEYWKKLGEITLPDYLNATTISPYDPEKYHKTN